MPYGVFLGYCHAIASQQLADHKRLVTALRISQSDTKTLKKYLDNLK